MDFGTDLALERYRLSKKAQQACDDIDSYVAYYWTAKQSAPPSIRIEPSQLEVIKISLTRLKVKCDRLNFKGVEVIAA